MKHLFLLALLTASCGQSGKMTASVISGLDTANMIPVTDAITIASNTLPGGFVAGAKLDLEDANGGDPENEPLSYEVEIFTSETGELWHVGVDAKTGAITEREVENSDGDGETSDDPNQ